MKRRPMLAVWLAAWSGNLFVLTIAALVFGMIAAGSLLGWLPGGELILDLRQ